MDCYDYCSAHRILEIYELTDPAADFYGRFSSLARKLERRERRRKWRYKLLKRILRWRWEASKVDGSV